jgi:hypothetical protein
MFIHGKRYYTDGKTTAQLEHMLQLAKDELVHYRIACRNYPPGRMERHGTPFIMRLEANINEIQTALKDDHS